MKRTAWMMIPVLAAALAAPAAPAALAAQVAPAAAPSDILHYVTARHEVTPIAQGLTLTAFERLYPYGWVNGWLLTADLAEPTLTSDVLTAPGVTEREPLLDMAAREGAVAAINGDFFALGGSGIALGTVVKGGAYLQSPQPEWPNGVLVGTDRIGRLATVALEGTVTTPHGTHPLTVVNTPVVPEGGLGIFTPLWTKDRPWAMGDAREGREVLVRAGRVVAVNARVNGDAVPEDGFILVGTGDAARFLDPLKPGDPVEVSYRPSPAVKWALGGQNKLVVDGEVNPNLDRATRRPRSAVGFSADGRRMYLLVIEGDSSRSAGATLAEMAAFMKAFGAAQALELDGGGSSTIVARRPGEPLTVLNLAASAQRPVPNGIGLFAAPGSGRARHLQIEGEGRVFPGLTRTFSVKAYDEQYGSAPVEPPRWGLRGPGTMAPDGRYTAVSASSQPVAPGTKVTVTAETEGLTAHLELRVLGPLARIEPQVEGGLALLDAGGRTFTVAGYDADGYRALIDPADLTLEYDADLVRVEPEGSALRAVPVVTGSGLITVSVQGHKAVIPFVSGMQATPVAVLGQPELWTFDRHPEQVTGSVGLAPGPAGGAAMALQYVFGPAEANRAAYLQAISPVALPGRPVRFGLWVKGDGQGAWLRAVLRDAAGATHTVDLAPAVDWTDWRYVEAAVPAAAAYPVSLYRIYPVETDTAKSYAGTLAFADLTVKMALPMPEAPAEAPAGRDVILEPGAQASEESWSFAVLAALPHDRPEAAVAEALEGDPKLFLVGAGLRAPVRAILAGLGRTDLPVYEMQPPARYVDAGGVRFILLGTGQGGLRSTAFHQWEELDALLAMTAEARAVRQVVVVGGESPLGFADSREGQLLQQRLTAFEEASGKQTAYLSAGGAAPAVTRVEGIPYIHAGTPRAPRLFTVDPAPGKPWIRLGP